MVNVKGESIVKGGKCTTEKLRPRPHTVTQSTEEKGENEMGKSSTVTLKDSFIPKIAKVYPLNPAEKEACKAFINEHLKTGWILPSKSPQASSFFFVPKKDGTL